ncbi:MAG: TonB-dependent receptor [Bacteroidaceae bacterium]|nr:TonB-dependent receptor [Bacteroidaceae bacterium]
MYNRKGTCRQEVITFKRFTRAKNAVLRSLRKEIRIGCLSVATLMTVHNNALATHSDSLQIANMHGNGDNNLSEIVISGSWIPVSLEESANKVEILTRQDIEQAKVETINDLLKLCSSVDVRQRGSMGVQTDIGIGGGTFDQVSILLNGISINNPHTGHLTADFPVSMNDIERIEIYDGASARYFGSQALNGAINIITRQPSSKSLTMQAKAGSYGTAGMGISGTLGNPTYKNLLSSDYLRTDGATSNSDFQRLKAFYQGSYSDPFVDTEWQLGYSYQRYGANTFYSANYPNQWERNNRITASFKGQTRRGKIRLAPRLSWVRSLDHFQLIRHTHTAENFHRNDVLTAGLSAHTQWALGRTAWGGEVRHEGIMSTNLGKPLDVSQQVHVEGHDNIFYSRRDTRTNISFFAEHALNLGPISLLGGIMGNRNSALNDHFYIYPGIDLRWRIHPDFKLYAGWNKSMRLPTFTDLYYKSPTQEGNIGLKPEKMSTFKLNGEYHHGWMRANVQGIYRKGSNMIDWVMFNANDIYHSTQFRLDNYELTAQAKADLEQLMGHGQPLRALQASYTYIYQKRHDDIEVYKSNYALEYLRHKLNLSLHHRIWRQWDATWYWIWQDRMGGYTTTDTQGNHKLKSYHPYSLLNLKVRWQQPKYEVYLSAENLTNHTYYDFGSIPQPGFTFLIGGNWHF